MVFVGWIAHVPSARGMPTGELVVAAVAGAAGLAALVAVGAAVRRGRAKIVRRAASVASAALGLPRWAALPSAVAGASMVTAVFGFYWDMSIHIDNGRDAGAFSNPSHVFILAGLVGLGVAAGIAALFGDDEDAPISSIRFAGWTMPAGGFLIMVCAFSALAGFPLDEVWHRLFGQDVTLWSPTHIQMIAGASLATLGTWVLSVEAMRARRPPHRRPWLVAHREPILAGAFLIGLSTLHAEFDFGVPQFALLFHPVLLVLAASIGLVAARIRLGRGGALKAALVFILIRGLLAMVVGPGLGRIMPHFPLYLVEAGLVELCASRVPFERPLRLGALCGVAIGTVGLAAEWGWSHLWMPIPWPAELLPEAAALGLAAAVAGGILGALTGQALVGGPRPRIGRWVPATAAAVVVLSLGVPAATAGGVPIRAEMDVAWTGPGRGVLTATLDPADAASDAAWFHVLSWQGLDGRRGASPRVELEEVGAGTYRTRGPVHLAGEWKTLLRLHADDRLLAVPVYLPEDPAIPAAEVPPPAPGEVRRFVPDARILQREAIPGKAGMRRVGYAALGGLGLLWIGAFAWGLARMARSGRGSSAMRSPAMAGR